MQHPKTFLTLCAPVIFLFCAGFTNAALRVPAYTAYLDPDPEAAEVWAPLGITGWAGLETKILWFGQIKKPGPLQCSVSLRLPPGTEGKFRLSAAGQSYEALAKALDTNLVVVSFGRFEISEPGYQRFEFTARDAGQKVERVDALILEGPAAEDAHFNLKPRRNAASVHLFYSVPAQTNIDAFYCEVTAAEDPVWTFYMACGWHRGYFGMQVNSPTERRIIFSVWDSGTEPTDRGKVEASNRVRLVAKGEGVYAGDFGNEGTGGHSHLKYLWRTGRTQRFYVSAKPAGAGHAIFSGYYFHPEKNAWVLISSWDAPKESGDLRGLHSFSENFGGANGHLLRKALYGNQWVHTAAGGWFEVTSASFSHDSTGRAGRLDRFMGVEKDQFFLSHGGYVPGFTEFGQKFTRPSSGISPPEVLTPQFPVDFETHLN